MAKKNRPLCEIAEYVSLSEDRVREWIKRFNELGYEGLLDLPRSGRPRKIAYEKILEVIDTGPDSSRSNMEFWTVPMLYKALSERFSDMYHERYLYQLIRRLGFSLKKPRPRHYKADPNAAEAVKRKIRHIVKEGHTTFYEDETRVFLTTAVKRVIVRRGENACMKVNVAHHQGVFVLGALNVETKEVKVMLSDELNSRVVMKFLYSLKRERGRGRIYIIWDNAGVHKAKRVEYLASRKGIHLVFLPPYSPHLNPVEEIWRQLKMHLANKLFTDMDELKREVMEFFERKGYKMEIKVSHYFSD